MRKFLLAGVASLAFCAAAIASTPAPSYSVSGTNSYSGNAGAYTEGGSSTSVGGLAGNTPNGYVSAANSYATTSGLDVNGAAYVGNAGISGTYSQSTSDGYANGNADYNASTTNYGGASANYAVSGTNTWAVNNTTPNNSTVSYGDDNHDHQYGQ